MEWFNLQTSLLLAYLFYGLTIMIHILVVTHVVPFNRVNGGRSSSYDVQKKLSYTSIGIAIIGGLFIGVNHLFPTLHENIVYGIFALILAAYWTLGYGLQWLGTSFERWVISWVLIIGIVSHLMLGLLAFI